MLGGGHRAGNAAATESDFWQVAAVTAGTATASGRCAIYAHPATEPPP